METIIGRQIISEGEIRCYHVDDGQAELLGRISIHADQQDVDEWRDTMCRRLGEIVGVGTVEFDWGTFRARIPATGPGPEQAEQDAVMRALRAIQASSLIDFEGAVKWAQWCRNLANAALLGDGQVVDQLLVSLPRSDQDPEEA